MLTNNQKKTIVLLMSLIMLLSVSATDIYISSLPQMVHDFNTSPSIINLTLSCFTLSMALMLLFIGEISNRYGRRPVILAGLAGFSITSFLIALTPSIYGVIFLRILQAIAGSVALIVPKLVLKDFMNEREQVGANGVLLIALVISPALAPVLGTYLSATFGWRSCFVLSGLLAGITFYLAYKIIPETNLQRLNKFSPLMQYLKIYVTLLIDVRFITLTGIFACASGAYFAFIGISSYLYINYWRLSPLDYSYIFIATSIAYLTGNRCMNFFNARNVSGKIIINLGVYSTIFGNVIMIISTFFANGTILICLVTLGVLFMRMANALIASPTQIKMMNYFSSYSAQALGLNMCIGFLMNGLALYVVTLLHFSPLFNLICINFILTVICLFVFIYNHHYL